MLIFDAPCHTYTLCNINAADLQCNVDTMPDHSLCVHSTDSQGKWSRHSLLGPSRCYSYMAQHHGTHAFTTPSLFSHTSIASHSPRFLYGIHSSGFISKPCTISMHSEGCIASDVEPKWMGVQPRKGCFYRRARHGIFIHSCS